MAGMVNEGIVKGEAGYIWTQGVVMLLVSLVGFTGALLNTRISAKIAYKLGGEMRRDIYRKVSQFSNDEFDKIGASSMITRNTNDVTQVQNLIEMGLKFLIMAPLYMVGGVFMAFRLSASLSTVFIMLVPIIAAATLGVSLYANPLFAKTQQRIDRLNLIFREGLNGVKIIRAFGKEKYEYDKYQSVNKEYTDLSVKANAVLGLLMPLMSLLMSLSAIAITWFGARGIADGTMEIGTIMGVIGYSMLILTGFMLITNVISSIPRGQTSARRINEVLDMPLSILDRAGAQTSVGGEASLTFEKVSFRYQGAERNALDNISFTVRKGQTLAIIGGTGAGKSTLVSLITRFYDPTSGSVRLNGTDVRDVTEKTLHDKISLVQQKSMLFFGTIRENMQIGNPGATDAEIWSALETAGAAEFVKTTDGALDAVVEKGGGNFSGGQKQRLCIARALLKRSGVYVFDDSFSALDFKTDAQIRASLREKMREAVTVIVAQRIGTIMGADLIIVLDEGRVAGIGTHDELKQTNATYKEIIASQFGRQDAA
jgi:ATP-binding cassette subfamily B protein